MKFIPANAYGVATNSRLLKITGLSGRIQSLLQGSFAKETCYFIDPTNRRHPIPSTAYLQWQAMSRLFKIIGLFCKRAL